MKRNRTLVWILIGFLTLLFSFAALTSVSFAWTVHGASASHPIFHGGHDWHGGHGRFGFERGFGRGAPSAAPPSIGNGWLYTAASIPLLMKIGLLMLGAVLWAKSAGAVKWSGAALSALTLMSLLTPFWGAVIVLLLLYISRRIKKDGADASAGTASDAFAGQALPVPAYSRGQFLDEWERNQRREK